MSTDNENVERFNRQAAAWEEEPRRVKLATEVAEAMLRAVPVGPDTEVLDFGCGTGLIALQLRPHVRCVTGADASPEMLKALRAKCEAGGVDGVSGALVNVERGGRLSGEYDLVVSSLVLHHLRDVPALLAQAFGVLRPGGRVALADLDSDDGEFHPDPAGVYHEGFEREVLAAWLQTTGFEQVEFTTAAEVTRPGKSGVVRTFPLFLATGRKPALG